MKLMTSVLKNFDRSVQELQNFADVRGEIALPDAPWDAAASAIVNAECAAAFQDLIESGRTRELQSVDDRIGGYAQLAVPAVDYINALRQRSVMSRLLHQAFDSVDAIVWPTMSTVAFPVGIPFDKAYPDYPGGADLTSPGNLCGWPAIAIPNGFGDHGLPTSLSLMGKPFAESAIASIASNYQQATDFHRKRPSLSAGVNVKTS